MIGYRTEELFGEGDRDAASVMAHETFYLSNTDILDTLSQTLFQNTEYSKELRHMSDVINCEIDDEKIEQFLDDAFDDEELGINYFNNVLKEIKKITKKDIKYVLWLCDSIEDIKQEYEINEPFISFNIYEKSDIVLSDLGVEGKLYGYENKQILIKEEILSINTQRKGMWIV